MKRKTTENGENSEPCEKPAEKRRRVNVAGESRPTFRKCSNKGVTIEELDGMGVEVIEDASNESFDQPQPRPLSLNLVLKPKDPNVKKVTQSCADFSDNAMHPPYPFDLSSSVLGDYSVSDKFHKYTKSLRRSLVSGEDTFNQMSDEVVLHVLKWLPKCSLARCALVCKRWCRLSKDDSLWRRVDLGLKTIHPGIIGQVLSRGTQVLRLARSSISAPIFQSPLCPEPSLRPGELCKLQYLDLSMATLDTSCLTQLLDICTNLRKLALEKCDVSESVCRRIGKNTKLDVLHLGMCEGLTPDGMRCILTGCRNLTELNLSWTDISEEGLVVVSSSAPRGLERLCLAGYRDTLQDSHLENLVTRCRNLRELDVSDATKISSQSLISIVENLVRLESLSTSRCYDITPSQYLLLLNCPALLYLNVYGLLRDTALAELRERLSGIEINKYPLTSIARPTIGIKRTSIWNLRVRD